MQNYKDWAMRWLGMKNDFGGELARLIHNDPDFPAGGDKKAIHERLELLGASQSATIAFLGCWKSYERDARKKPREVTLENRLVHEVERRGGICWKFVSPGTVGVPDRIVMIPGGKVIFVEMKAPGKKLRPLQQKRADQIQAMSVSHYCLNSNQDIAAFLQEIFGHEV